MNKCEVEQGCTAKDCKDPKHHTLLHKFAEAKTENDHSVFVQPQREQVNSRDPTS